jgi:hypothetical protein
MKLQQQISIIDLANTIKEFYSFCGYDLGTYQIVELSKLILQSWEKITSDQFNKFITRVKLGEFGMIYKTPLSFMVAFNEFKKSNFPQERFEKDAKYDLIPIEGLKEFRHASNSDR